MRQNIGGKISSLVTVRDFVQVYSKVGKGYKASFKGQKRASYITMVALISLSITEMTKHNLLLKMKKENR